MFAACFTRPLALLTSRLFFSISPAILENRLARPFMLVCRRGNGTPSTRLRRRLEISARPAMAVAAVATVAAAAPFATVPAPLRAFATIESAGLFALAALVRLETERVRGEADVFFAEVPFLLDAERALALFLGFAVLGTGSSWNAGLKIGP
jgi:hypothetical protein